MADLEKDEAQLIAVYRAIKDFSNFALVAPEEVGDVFEGLTGVINLDEVTKGWDGDKVKALVYGFVAGWGATKLPQLIEQINDEIRYEEIYGPPVDEKATEFIGGPTGGVAVGQGTDPDFVVQTGPQKDNG